MAENARYPHDAFRRAGRLAAATILGLWLFWQIGGNGIAGLAVNTADSRLLAFSGTIAHPESGSMLAEAMLRAGDNADAARLARSIVLVDPTNDQALRVLGIAVEQLGDRNAAADIMGQAAGLGWRDIPTQLWTLRDAILRNNAVTIIQRTDALARGNRAPNLTRTILLAAVNDPQLRSALEDSLANQPLWRTSFFSDVRQHLPLASISGMEALFHEMHARRMETTENEWLDYINRLIDLGEYRRARKTWADTFAVPVERSNAIPTDANFALAAAHRVDEPTSPFQWTLNPDLIGAVTFAGDGHGSALAIPADLPGGTSVISQLVMLAPGTHDLSARIDGDPDTAAVGWNIACLPSGQSLPRRLALGEDNELSSLSFEVPSANCTAQRLSLMTRDRLDAKPVSITDVHLR